LPACASPLGGAGLGHWLDGTEGSMRGFAIGFVLGGALAALFGWLMVKMRAEYHAAVLAMRTRGVPT
jgi:hypothetical protein